MSTRLLKTLWTCWKTFGGHTYAGLSMKVENVEEFTHRFETYVTEHILPEQTSAVIDIDAEIDFRTSP